MRSTFRLVSNRDIKSKQMPKDFDWGIDVLNNYIFRNSGHGDDYRVFMLSNRIDFYDLSYTL